MRELRSELITEVERSQTVQCDWQMRKSVTNETLLTYENVSQIHVSVEARINRRTLVVYDRIIKQRDRERKVHILQLDMNKWVPEWGRSVGCKPNTKVLGGRAKSLMPRVLPCQL